MKKICRYLFSLFGLVPYDLTLKLVQWISVGYDRHLKVWARNSYIFKAIEPGFSDLDLTLYASKKCDVKQAYKFLNFIERFRSVWPLIGEINLYFENEIEFSLAYINSFELNRDRYLIKHINFVEKFSSAEAAVFLFRQLEKDIHNLSKSPKSRIKKWNYHFKQLEELLPGFKATHLFDVSEDELISSIISTIVLLCEINHPIFTNDLNEKLHMYFEFLIKGVDFSKLRPLIIKDSWIYVFSIHKIAFLELTPFTLSVVQQEIMSLQVKWELWGLKTQFRNKISDQDEYHKKYLFDKIEKQNLYQSAQSFVDLLGSSFFN